MRTFRLHTVEAVRTQRREQMRGSRFTALKGRTKLEVPRLFRFRFATSNAARRAIATTSARTSATLLNIGSDPLLLSPRVRCSRRLHDALLLALQARAVRRRACSLASLRVRKRAPNATLREVARRVIGLWMHETHSPTARSQIWRGQLRRLLPPEPSTGRLTALPDGGPKTRTRPRSASASRTTRFRGR